MKKILFTLSVSCFSIAYAQNLNFADSKFKALILSSTTTNEIAKDLNGNFIAIDANGDGEVQVSEAQQVKTLKIKQDPNLMYIDPTKDLEVYDPDNINVNYYNSHLPDGITDALLFPNMEELYVIMAKSFNINFINNNKIRIVKGNPRYYSSTFQDTTVSSNLTFDNCSNLQNIADVVASVLVDPWHGSGDILRIKNCSQINSTALISFSEIKELYIENSNISNLSIDSCPLLNKIHVPNLSTLTKISSSHYNTSNYWSPLAQNQYIELVANNCINLEEITVSNHGNNNTGNYFTSVNINGCTALKKLSGLNDPSIDFSTAGLINLEELDCSYQNKYTYASNTSGSAILGNVNFINLSGLQKLKKLKAYNQRINNINFAVCPLLEEINLVNTIIFISSIDVNNLVNLHTLNLSATDLLITLKKLQQINAQNCTALVNLEIFGNDDLHTLNLQNCSSLKSLKIGEQINYSYYINYFPEFTNLNIAQCTSLEDLLIWNTKINNLNTSDCTQLKSLKLSGNNFHNQIDLSNNLALENLEVQYSPLLTNFNLSNNVNLKTVLAKTCPLITQLDLSGASHLEIISSHDMANLTSINVRNSSNEAISLQNYNSNLSVCVDDAQLIGLQTTYPNVNFSTSCNNLFTTTWNGTSWSNGTPSSIAIAVLTGSYSTASQPTFTAKNIIIQNSGILEITSGNTISAVNVTVEDGGNLIQKDGSNLSYSGVFKTLKNGTSDVNKYAFWTSPVVGQNLTNIYTGATPAFITEYDTATDNYVNTSSTTSVFGKGYSIKTPVANAALVFEGTPNNGTQTFALATSGNGFNLIGNPYPSNLNLGAFYTVNSARISSTFYFWDNKSTNVTLQNGATTTNYGYATFNAANSANPTWVPAPNDNGGTAVVPMGTVANIGQGFIVKALNASVDTSLTFNNEMRSATNATFFNKDNSSTEGKFWLKLNSEYNTNNTFAVDYTNGASDLFDNYDSKAIGTGSDAFYTLADAQKLIIQGKESFDINDVVPVGVKHFQNGTFTIALVKKEGLFDNGQAIYLHDKVTGTYTDLQNGIYSFTTNAGENTNRFEIVYKLSVLATAEVKKDAFKVYRDGQDFVVRNDKNIEKIEIFDAAGRKVQTINENSKLIRVQLSSKGVYILKALSAGKEYSKKIIK